MVVPLHASIQNRKETGSRIRLAWMAPGQDKLTAALPTELSAPYNSTVLSLRHRCHYSGRPRALQGTASQQVRVP